MRDILKKIGKVINPSLFLCAIINIYYLFFTILPEMARFEGLFTKTSAFILALSLVQRLLEQKKKIKLRFIIPDLAFIIILFSISGSNRVFQIYLLGRQTYYIVNFLIAHFNRGELKEKLSNNPPVIVLISFLLAIFIGSLLLMLPNATVDGQRTSFMGAVFTSTSATCVTGLIVYDTATHFTMLGQTIILFLIQIGGLGIMTISSAFAIMLGQRMTIKHESMMLNVVGGSNKIDMRNLIRSIILATVIIELIGAAILYFTFHNEFNTINEATYYSVFHSISAFCNAGFSLYSDNFMDFKFNFNINFVITSLIILGGIGFPVISDVKKQLFKKPGLIRLSLHSKIVITTTSILILIGMIGFFIAEYNQQMAGFNIAERLYTSYFQSVTTRTAGFNTLDNGTLSYSSIMLTIILMFIGASPGSTGGGVKTTTLAVIFVSVSALFRGNRDVNIFRRRVADDIIKKVMALIAISILIIFFMIFLLFMTESLSFEKILFEAISAFGTVGLSMGITSQLTAAGKGIIIFLMYFGRVGPLTLIFAISGAQAKSHFTFAEEKFSIG
ncbi:MAG: potassium transporter Trk [Candidatus Cloacimonetes bacterium]|nr:potassium transporter Trk [Candidatus Cloacimonadota bacterium]